MNGYDLCRICPYPFGLPERELEKLKAEAERLGKGSVAFAFYRGRRKDILSRR